MSDSIKAKPIGLVDKAALFHLQSKELLRGFSHLDVWIHEHAVAFTIAKMMDLDMLAEVKRVLIEAQQTGMPFGEFKKRLKPYLMSKGWWGEQVVTDPNTLKPQIAQLGSTRRLKTIFNTNMQTAFAAGQWQRIQATKQGLPYLRYNRSSAHQPRDSHRRYYGLVLPVDHYIWQYIFPPNGYGCKCTVSQLTRQQAEREGISPEPEIKWQEVVNKRTGEVVTVPAHITPSFAHNHGNRIQALEKLFGEKHGKNALQEMIKQREAYLGERYEFKHVPLLRFDDEVAAKIDIHSDSFKNLAWDSAKQKSVNHEAIAIVQFGQKYDDIKEVKRITNNSIESSADFMVVYQDGTSQSIDFMFTMDSKDKKSIDKFNEYFQTPKKQWYFKIQNIQKHLSKADIVPLDLRHLNQLNRVKLLEYVLSLPKEQRDRIILIVEESK